MFVLKITSKIEPLWTIVLVPIWQEIVFRYLPFIFWYLPTGNFLLVGFVSSLLFALIHWYFGRWFVFFALIFGFVYWFVMVQYGLLAAILIHAIVNTIDLTFGIRNFIEGL